VLARQTRATIRAPKWSELSNARKKQGKEGGDGKGGFSQKQNPVSKSLGGSSGVNKKAKSRAGESKKGQKEGAEGKG